MDLNLKGKTAIVTGGSGVIGRSLLLAFAAEGANAVSASRNVEFGQEIVKLGAERGYPGRILAVKTDITDRASVDRMVEATHAEFGPVDILVNNAGGVANPNEFDVITDEERAWERGLSIDGVINCIQAVAKDLQARRGAIVNISTMAASKGIPSYVHYGAVKSFADGLTRGLATEWGPKGVRINNLSPGLVAPEDIAEASEGSFWNRLGPDIVGTPDAWQQMLEAGTMPGGADILVGRLGRPRDIANAVLFLASDAAGFITGQTLHVNGGAYR